jgi:hypothetical protein
MNEPDIIARLRDLIDYNLDDMKTEASQVSPSSHFYITTASGYKYSINVVLDEEPQ